MSSSDDTDHEFKGDDDIKVHLKTLSDKVNELESKKSRRSKAFRETKSEQMKRYHARKRNLEQINSKMEKEMEELRKRLLDAESELEKLRKPKQVETKRRNVGLSDCFQRLDELDFTISPFH